MLSSCGNTFLNKLSKSKLSTIPVACSSSCMSSKLSATDPTAASVASSAFHQSPSPRERSSSASRMRCLVACSSTRAAVV